MTGKEKLSDLRDEASPEELVTFAEKLYERFTSNEALAELEKVKSTDFVYRNSVMFIHDALDYLELYKAMRADDSGRMELLIPDMLFRFLMGIRNI